ncbi:FeoB-associated Cys-rich membrane protein [Bacteroides sp. AM07-16]|nr:FeoB-associated Cys-rich membrane protein [Parabacteroides bouchesdurhonensis]RHJ95231.1 FeoB-associated Cys-rich membrane protein [Bacteroides sp. AM07-16]
MWQEIAIIIIGIAIIVYVSLKCYKSFTTKRNPNNPCCGCNGCSLKEEVKKKEIN